MNAHAFSQKTAELATKLMRRQNISAAPEQDRFNAFGYVIAHQPAFTPAFHDVVKAFNGFINLGAMALLPADLRREAAFIAARIKILLNNKADVEIFAPDEYTQACALFRLANAGESEEADFVIEAKNDEIHLQIVAKPEFSGIIAEAIAGFESQTVKANPAGLARIEAAFAQFAAPVSSPLNAKLLPQDTSVSAPVSHVFDRWEPNIVRFDGMQNHPSKLIEARPLASVRPIGLTKIPNLDLSAIASGEISNAQLEAATLAINAHERRIEIVSEDMVLDVVQGFYLGDGTGAGKSVEGIAIIQHHWNEGRKRHILLLEKDNHIDQFRKALHKTKTKAPLYRFDQAFASGSIAFQSGIIAITYATLRQVDTTGEFKYVKPLIDWMNADPKSTGVILFDEAQNMGNAPEAFDVVRESAWHDEPSLQARAGCQLQDMIPEARVVYSSATAAVDMYKFAYASRLGLWGPSAPYPSFSAFLSNHSISTHAAEAIPLHLKANGVLVCRSLSMEGVTYNQINHILDTAQTDYYETFTSLMAATKKLIPEITDAYNEATASKKKGIATLADLGLKDHPSWSAKLTPMQIFKSLGTLLLDTIDIAMLMPTSIAAIDAALERGEAVIIQVSHTQEADTLRARAAGAENSDANTIVAPIMSFLDTVIKPIIEATLITGRAKSPTLMADFEFLRTRWTALPPLTMPLDTLLGVYGPDRIAEMTGRSVRRVPKVVGNLSAGMTFQERLPNAAYQEYQQFMADRRDILIFSTAFGGSGNDYHAANDCRNQRRRNHFILEVGSRADAVIQGIGRSHRNNQAVDPIVSLMTSDVPGSAIATTRVRRSISNLGALSMGHREATNRSIFDSFDDFDSPAASQALMKTMIAVKDEAYPEISHDEAIAYLPMFHRDKEMRFPTENGTLQQFKALRFAPLSFQRRFIERYMQQYHALPDSIRNQRTDGPYVVKNPLRVISEQRLFEDKATGEYLTAVKLAGELIDSYPTYAESYADALNYCMPGETPLIRYKKSQNRIMIQARFDNFDPEKPMRAIWRVYSPDGIEVVNSFARTMLATAPLATGVDPAKIWDENTQRLRDLANAEKILVTGSLLKLAAQVTEMRFNRLVIVTTEDGRQIAGYLISQTLLDIIRAEAPTMAQTARQRDRQNALDALENGNGVMLENGWSMRREFIPLETLSASTQIALKKNASVDKDEAYIAVHIPSFSSRKIKLWAMKNKLIPTTDGISNTLVIAPWRDREEKMKAILSIASPTSFEL